MGADSGAKALKGLDAAAVPDSGAEEVAVAHAPDFGSEKAVRGVRFRKELQRRILPKRREEGPEPPPFQRAVGGFLEMILGARVRCCCAGS